MKRALVFIAVALSVLVGLAALYTSVWVTFFTDSTDCDCSKGEAVFFGVAQGVTALALLVGAFAAVTRRVRLATIAWVVGILGLLGIFFWIWQIAVPVALLVGLGIWALRTDRSATT